MPIFEYECEQCGHVTEVLERPGAKGPHTCEKCGAQEMTKLFSSFGLGAKPASGGSRPAGGSGFS